MSDSEKLRTAIKKTGWVPASLIPLGATMIGLHRFSLAYISIGVAMLWLILLWEYSDKVYKQLLNSNKAEMRSRSTKPQHIQRYRHERRRLLILRVGGIIAGLSISAPLLFYVHFEENDYEFHQTFGILTPASDPMPENPCRDSDPPSSAIRVYAAGGMDWSDKSRFALVEIGNQDVLSVEREGDRISISGDIYTSDGDAVHIERNQFETQDNSAFKPIRPDRHTLQVLDKWHEEVLYIRFLNSNAVQVRGVFWKPGRPFPLIVDDHSMRFGHDIYESPCSEAANVAIKVS